MKWLLFFLPLALLAEEPIDFSGSGCIQYEGMRYIPGSRYALSFKNWCPMPVYISVCTVDSFGDKELYTSSNRVPMMGRYTRAVDDQPSHMEWAASHLKPTVPALCQ